MTTNHFINQLGVATDFTSRQSRFDSLSILSRQSVLAILLLCLTLGVGRAWSTELTAYTLTPASGSNNSYAGHCDIDIVDDVADKTITWYLEGNSQQQPWRIGVAKKTAAGSTTRSLYSKNAISENITKVIVTHGAKSGMTAVTLTLNVYSTAAKAETGGTGDISSVSVTYADNTTMTFNRPEGHNWAGKYFRFDYGLTWTKNNNDPQFIRFSSAVFKYNSCTALASINGSVSWSNGTSATLTWDKLSGVRASTPYAVSVSPSAGVTVNSIDLTGAKATCSVTGLTAGTAYTFTINAYGDASHCDKSQEISSTAPKITVKSAPIALTGSDYAEGVLGGGTVKTFTVSGVGLTGALTFTAPANFQVSTDNGSTWSTSGGSKTLAASGTLAETTIKARLVEGLSAGNYGGATTYITISGGGAAAVNSSVSIAGTVSSACSVPTIGNPSLTSITGTTITVSCPTISGGTNCDVDEYGFIWKVGSAPTMASYDGKKKTGENNQSTAYNDGLSIDVANNTGTTYYIKAYAHNSAGNNVSGTALEVTPQSVAFNMNGHGSQVATQYVNNGSKASEPSAPSASYYTFNGWKLSGSAYNFSTATVTSNITLDADWSVIPVTALTLNYSTLKRYVGESDVTLSVSSVTPGTANPAVTWTSSDATVASVDGGVVSFLKAGTATITATSTISGGVTATCSVEVRSISSPTMQDEDGTTISGSGLSATWTLNTRTLAASEGTSKYKFKRWIVTNATPASTTNLSTTLGDPTGNVTVVAEFYKPRTVTKGTGTGTSTFTVSPTGEVKYGSSVTVTCAATDGYKNPWTLTVTPSEGATYDETGSTGSITISNITKNITVDLAYVDKGCTTHKGNGVDEGSSYSNVYGPVNDNWKYGARQILYTKSDLGLAAGKKGTIKSISFQYQYSTAISDKDKVKIYMANTNLTSLSTSNYVTSFTEVYSGSMNCSNGWNEIELDTDFDYNGVGNLLVVIEDYSGKYTGSSYAFYYHEATTGIQLYNTTDGSAYDITTASTWTGGTAVAYRPNTKFCIEEDDMVEATVNWYVNGSIEHTQTDYPGTAFDEIPTPDSGDCGGEKEFVGWYTDDYTHASVAPAFVNPTVIPEGGADYYAVFATVTPTNNYQQITSEGDLVAGAKYLIVGNSSTMYNALPVDAATSLSSVSPSGTPLTISNPGATLIWTLEGSADAWRIKSTNNNKYIQISSGILTFETSTSLTFSVDVSSNIFTFTSSAASGNKKLSYYHDGKPSQFNAYSSANTVYVFKQVVTATNYATTCAETYDVARAGSPAGTVTGGTFTVSPSKQAEGKSVTLSATPDLGYSFGSWTVTKTESPYTDITSTNVAGNTLTMPAYGVTVNASFTPTPTLTATGGDLSSTTLPFGTSCEQDEGTDKTFVLNGYSLTNDVTLTIGGTDASMFSVKSPSSPIDKGTGRINDQTVTVTFTPTSTGAKTATLTIASSGASSIVLTLSGTAIKHYKVHYWNSGTDVHQESVLAGEDASATWDGVDDEDGCDTETYKYFVGWSKTNVGSIPTTTKPTIGETYTSLSSDVNYYAVWTNVNPNGWERYESATIAEGDYLVVEKSSTTYYTMKNTMTGTRMDHGVAVLSGSLISAPSSELSYDWNDFIWHIAKPDPDKAEYTFYNADESKYVASTGTASQVAFVASPSDGKELFTYTYDGTNKTYNWTNKYNSGQSVNATFRDANSGFSCYASQSHTQYLYYRAGGTAKYITNCCDKNVTLATNSPSHGSITFSPEGPISTCGADAATRQTTMTVTPDEGYYLSTWSTSGVTPASLSTDIAYGSTSNSGAQATTVTFTQNTTTGTYTANATFTAIPVSSLTLHAIKKDNTSATIFEETGNNVALSLYPTEGKTASPADPLGHTVKIEFGAVLPANALNKGYTWSATVNGAAVGWSTNNLENNAVLEFNKSTGKVVAKAAGTAEIIITADDGSGVTAKVTITVTNVALSSLNVAKSSTTLYVGEAEEIAVTYDPVNTTTKGYTTGSYTYVTVGRSNNKITLTGKAATSEVTERVTLTSSDAGAKTATIDVTVKPLPKVTFVDNLQGKTDFSNWGSDGVVSSTVTDGVVTHMKPTPSHTDISDPGASYNACERNHLHLVGWIESTWADAHPSATHSEITGANASNGEGTFLEAGADFNVETYNGNTYYAVWSQVE